MQENSYAAAQAITTAMKHGWGAALDLMYSTLEEFTVLQPVLSIAEICGDTCSLNGTVVCLHILGSLRKHDVDGCENVILKCNFSFPQSFLNYSKSARLQNVF